MALTIEGNNEFGFTSGQTYVKINRFSGTKDQIELDLTYYASPEARANNKRPFTVRKAIISYPTIGVRDIMEYCYEQLKLQSEFYNSTDI